MDGNCKLKRCKMENFFLQLFCNCKNKEKVMDLFAKHRLCEKIKN
jgi:hypothetical protein